MHTRAFTVAAIAALAPSAFAQFSPVLQERSVQTQANLSSGASDSDSDEASNFSAFIRSLNSNVTGAGAASADATAAQNSSFSANAITGALTAHTAAITGSTFIVGEAQAQSSLLFIFNLSSPTSVQFLAQGELALHGHNPDGEPSDLSGMASVRLLNGITEELIAGFTLSGGNEGIDGASFNGLLPAGQYVILANARNYCYSADLLGPPARTGSGDAQVSFSLTVPAPSAAALLGMGLLATSRRRSRR